MPKLNDLRSNLFFFSHSSEGCLGLAEHFSVGISHIDWAYGASLVAQRVKRLPAMWETQVRFLGWEDPLEKEMATHSSILAWRIPWTEEPGRL